MAGAARQRAWQIDLFRGLALVMIFINHVPDNPLAVLTSANYGFSDAAEGFVLMAGIAAGLVYLRKHEQEGWGGTFARAWTRAFELYSAHLLILLLSAAFVAWMATAEGDERLLGWIGLGPLFQDPAAALIGIVALLHQPNYLDILPLYIVLLLAVPLMVPLAARAPALLLALSGSLWFTANWNGWNAPTFPSERGWMFNPLAWQFLFAIGMVIGTRLARGLPVVPRSNLLFAAALAYVVAACVIILDLEVVWPVLPLPWFLYGLDKSFLSLPRLLHVLALAVVLARLPVAQAIAWLDRPGVLMLLGRHALPVFCAGSVLAVAVQIFRFTLGAEWWLEVLLVLAGLAVQVALAMLLAWSERTRGAPPRVAAASAGKGGTP
ncbi:MAG: OpgC domain-containing protein [Acetobacteraceae bacterium]|nr:OpgC domain-containing protein [Acetobacteraceae bacterium]MCX7685456.1 OpgC domain-containing protein [Acetobacteraceae bacterium]MDW8399031.1 OpgC domain-containing protein [Acetobacteraceae bacterium]